MKRTISVMLGKGSVNHNSRQFMATNIDTERTSLNISYYNTPIKDVYHELFSQAVRRYNAKLTRTDRCIDDYYEKIRTGKQERLFYEVIVQIGNMENMASKSDDGQLAAKVLDKFMTGFQERNPYLKVFSAHLHMDEATPHLHVDFVPFITCSKRGLDTRVSLKQALAAQGFIGGARGYTEWNQWVKSEKERLSHVMERHGIEWEQLGTHDEHLSVMDYKKVQRAKEVAALEVTISEKQGKLETIKNKERFIADNVKKYDDAPEFQLSPPKPLMSAKSYHEQIAAPLVNKLKDVIRSILFQFFDQVKKLKTTLRRANNKIWDLSDRVGKLEPEIERLSSVEKDYRRVRRFLGGERTDEIISEVKALEGVKTRGIAKKQPAIEKREYVR